MGDSKEHGEDLDDRCLDDDVFEDCIARVRPADGVTSCQFRIFDQWHRHRPIKRALWRRVGGPERQSKIETEKIENTNTIPQGVASVHVLPAAVAMSFVKLEPRTKSQKNLGKKQPQMPAQRTSANERRQAGRRESADER